ncbi:hypothetical protein TNCV_1173171 [Trichonephila clavipes]|uniref:Uncharacterized protein n=1 Tax=Trichonephila clavipes TaxID=2585209 RepID=A0A8X6RYA9_TRICX|nr:hypothetical protein TNCV_1173171 [Trichonephila clavipes]
MILNSYPAPVRETPQPDPTAHHLLRLHLPHPFSTRRGYSEREHWQFSIINILFASDDTCAEDTCLRSGLLRIQRTIPELVQAVNRTAFKRPVGFIKIFARPLHDLLFEYMAPRGEGLLPVAIGDG